MEKIVVATHNPSKKKWYQKILSGFTQEVLGLSDLDFSGKPKESGKTAEENAIIKATFYTKRLSLPVLGEDAALFVDFLPEDQQPGVFVRRVNDKELDDDELLAYWESIVVKVPKGKRTGRWHTAHCFATPDGKTALSTLDYHILFFSPSSKIRVPGWSMNSLSGPVEFKKPEVELTKEERKKLRQRAEELLALELKKLLTS